MKVRKFRIKNYRSIIDLGDCFPSERVTIFAGMNESGKSSVLQALSDFNVGNPISDDALPLHNKETPEITVEFQLTEVELRELPGLRELVAPKGGVVTIRKTHPNAYELDESTIRSFNLDMPAEDRTTEMATLNDGLIELSAQVGYQLQPFASGDLPGVLARARKFKKIYLNNRASVSESTRQRLDRDVDALINGLDALITPQPLGRTFRDKFLARMPNFILFSSFDQVLPNQVPLSELESNEWIDDLRMISDLDVNTITGPNLTLKRTHKHHLNLEIKTDFEKFWTQDASRLSVDWDSNHLQFWIEEDNRFYPPQVRSQGKRWHLAFYIRVTARAREDVDNVILIDEPGLYLHARAQRDILKLLEQASDTQQVMFSTHSPYLIETEKLDRIRLLIKTDARGSYIENKVHAVADKETLTPILSAIGLDLNQGILASDKLNNVLVEGPSDYFYLTAFAILRNNDRLKFVAGGGAGNMPVVGTILLGWGAKVIYLYDNDQAYQNALKSIQKTWATLLPKWLAALNIVGSIEDVFEKQEFADFVLHCPVEKITGKNSAHMSKRDKVLPARKFLELARSENPPKLSPGTLQRVDSMFKDLEARFMTYNTLD